MPTFEDVAKAALKGKIIALNIYLYTLKLRWAKHSIQEVRKRIKLKDSRWMVIIKIKGRNNTKE